MRFPPGGAVDMDSIVFEDPSRPRDKGHARGGTRSNLANLPPVDCPSSARALPQSEQPAHGLVAAPGDAALPFDLLVLPQEYDQPGLGGCAGDADSLFSSPLLTTSALPLDGSDGRASCGTHWLSQSTQTALADYGQGLAVDLQQPGFDDQESTYWAAEGLGQEEGIQVVRAAEERVCESRDLYGKSHSVQRPAARSPSTGDQQSARPGAAGTSPIPSPRRCISATDRSSAHSPPSRRRKSRESQVEVVVPRRRVSPAASGRPVCQPRSPSAVDRPSASCATRSTRKRAGAEGGGGFGLEGERPLAASSRDSPPFVERTPHDEEDAAFGHLRRAASLAVQPVTAADAAVLVAVTRDWHEVSSLVVNPAAWGLSCQPSHDPQLTNVKVEQIPAAHCWMVVATVRRPADYPSPAEPGTRHAVCPPGHGGGLPRTDDVDDGDGPYCPTEGEAPEGRPREGIRGNWTAREDADLKRWKADNRPWWWIYQRFPARTSGAVSSRWYVLNSGAIKPRAEQSARGRHRSRTYRRGRGLSKV
ncbi:hypothetical protein CLAIMM_14610 [Cladophialophora immunda]|nr:hypothetical protein CLAIMM_14610 [Cladophialophora immunda]